MGSIGAGGDSAFMNTHPFLCSVLMILATEIGDRTFLVACILSIQHNRIVVLSGALLSLALMSLISAFLGRSILTLVSKSTTDLISSFMFLYFGIRMGIEGYKMSDSQEALKEEMMEVEQEIEKLTYEYDSIARLEANVPENPTNSNTKQNNKLRDYFEYLNKNITNLLSYLMSPLFAQTFILTFVSEWGDRSQIATIAMAANANYYSITLGTIFGHFICTSLAVLGGKLMANRISIRHVTLGGAALFILFGIINLVDHFRHLL